MFRSKGVGKELQKVAVPSLVYNPGIEGFVSTDINLNLISFLILLFIRPELNIERC